VWLMLNRNEMKLGGTNGLTDFKSILGVSLSSPGTLRALYIVTAGLLVGALLASRAIVRSKTGLVLEAIRDNERRLEFLGYNTAGFKIFVFAVSAALAGLAGLLYAPQVGIITPSQVGVLPSLEIVIWVAFGGRGTLWGALVGAISVNWLRSVLTATYPALWPIILGGLFVTVIMLFPEGLVALAARAKTLLARRRRAVAPPAIPASGGGRPGPVQGPRQRARDEPARDRQRRRHSEVPDAVGLPGAHGLREHAPVGGSEALHLHARRGPGLPRARRDRRRARPGRTARARR